MFSFLQWRSVRNVELLLAALGLILTIYHIREGVFAEGKSLRGSYRVVILADRSETFPISAFARPEIAQANRIIELDVILWNSGGQIISHDDIRGDDHLLFVDLELGNSSHLLDGAWKLAKQNSSIKNNFELRRVNNNSFSLTWRAIDPGDFVQASFLVATNLDKEQLDNISAKFGGSVTGTKGNVVASVSPFSAVQRLRAAIFMVIATILTIGIFLLLLKLIPDNPPNVVVKWGTGYQIAAIIVMFLVCLFASGIIGVVSGAGVAQYLAGIPDWSSLSYASLREALEQPLF